MDFPHWYMDCNMAHRETRDLIRGMHIREPAVDGLKNTHTHMIHVLTIYQHLTSKSHSFVGKYTSTMEHMGYQCLVHHNTTSKPQSPLLWWLQDPPGHKPTWHTHKKAIERAMDVPQHLKRQRRRWEHAQKDGQEKVCPAGAPKKIVATCQRKRSAQLELQQKTCRTFQRFSPHPLSGTDIIGNHVGKPSELDSTVPSLVLTVT